MGFLDLYCFGEIPFVPLQSFQLQSFPLTFHDFRLGAGRADYPTSALTISLPGFRPGSRFTFVQAKVNKTIEARPTHTR